MRKNLFIIALILFGVIGISFTVSIASATGSLEPTPTGWVPTPPTAAMTEMLEQEAKRHIVNTDPTTDVYFKWMIYTCSDWTCNDWDWGGRRVWTNRCRSYSDWREEAISYLPAGTELTSFGTVDPCPLYTWATATLSTEIKEAYDYALANGITTQNTLQNADALGELTRAHMAKMIVNFAEGVLHKRTDNSSGCEFNDISNQSEELQHYIVESCQLGLMGQGIDAFNPESLITRAQFGTLLSRTLHGDTYNGGDPYYADHLQALKNAGIMNNISNPNALEIRGYVWVMLQRAENESKSQ
ncbi:MAG: hypothetical protein ACD_80C00097G0002 [uncultured bacterium (gcode 4)]|uniref:S-layer protein n=1 Tax=uncultured bacterium (gcode 4) TaxID=1234023 RepID=K1X515_9BACT|nr:MAG: hypothetical protein ACD_80C00097G0002 [uncultured bacterium (gcode 4)]